MKKDLLHNKGNIRTKQMECMDLMWILKKKMKTLKERREKKVNGGLVIMVKIRKPLAVNDSCKIVYREKD